MLRPARILAPAALLALALSIPASTGALAGTSVFFQAAIGSCQLEGTADVNAKLRIIHKSPSGALKGTYNVTADNSGEWQADCDSTTLKSKDRLAFRTRPAGILLRSVTLPVITANADRVADTVTGVITLDPSVHFEIFRCNLVFCGEGPEETISPAGDGSYTWNVAEGFDGNDEVVVTWAVDSDSITLARVVPTLLVAKGKATVSGRAQPGSTVTVTFKRGTKVGKFTGTARFDGSFSGTVKRNGTAMKLAAGDRVRSTLASDVDFVVPVLNVTAGDTKVSGHCFPEQGVSITVKAPNGSLHGSTAAMADPSGAWTADTDTPSGYTVTAFCNTGQDDFVRLRTVVS